MRITALLPWYDERASWLAGLVASVAPFCDHLIAFDGAYMLYPDGRGASPSEQHEALIDTAIGAGLALDLVVPSERWRGEVEKRAALFAHGLADAEADEWFLTIDADEFVRDPVDRAWLEHDLAAAEFVATAWVNDARMARKFWRALPGLTVEQAHYVYTVPVDGVKRYLWGADHHPVEPAAPTLVRMVHRDRDPSEPRRRAQTDYYERRDAHGVERLEAVV